MDLINNIALNEEGSEVICEALKVSVCSMQCDDEVKEFLSRVRTVCDEILDTKLI